MIEAARPLSHLGIIPDGNRRHARETGMSTSDGYMHAADKGVELIGWCLAAGVAHVSAFGVSQENIALRPRDEICSLHVALLHFCSAIPQSPGTALDLFGDATSLPTYVPGRACFIDMSDRSVDQNAKLIVHVGINYSAQAEMRSLLRAVAGRGLDAVSRAPNEFTLSGALPPVDLVIRTGGQRRLSGFLPFQTAYSELWFTDTLWPSFTRNEFTCALDWYARQDRRFGE
jgi:short-chain Z-isoprenyl diphosphate synthase